MRNEFFTLTICDVEQYESLVDLFVMLAKLGIKAGGTSKRMLEDRCGDEYERCDYCDAPHHECVCSIEHWNDRYEVYSDEASFE